MVQWLIDNFYFEGDLLKTAVALLGFWVLLLVILEAFYIIKSATKSVF